jgi:hypothetical protein
MNTKISVKRLVIFVFISDEFCKNWVKNDRINLGFILNAKRLFGFQTENLHRMFKNQRKSQTI